MYVMCSVFSIFIEQRNLLDCIFFVTGIMEVIHLHNSLTKRDKNGKRVCKIYKRPT